jgi:positive regulator of sigma E activity
LPASEPLTLPAEGETIPVGATVTLTVPESNLLLGAMLVYGLPLAALLLGAAGAATLWRSDLAAAAGAGLGLLAALLVTSLLRGRVERALFRRLDVRRAT